ERADADEIEQDLGGGLQYVADRARGVKLQPGDVHRREVVVLVLELDQPLAQAGLVAGAGRRGRGCRSGAALALELHDPSEQPLHGARWRQLRRWPVGVSRVDLAVLALVLGDQLADEARPAPEKFVERRAGRVLKLLARVLRPHRGEDITPRPIWRYRTKDPRRDLRAWRRRR